MSSCDESNIIKNYIVQSPSDFDILSACTGFYTNNIYNCTGDTLTLHSPTVSANAINATTLSACSGIWTSSLSGCSPITVHDELILLSGLTFSAITEDNSLTQILVRDSVSGLVKYINFSAITQDNTLTNILAKDPITGEIKYRSVESIISAATSGDTFVTGFTYDNSNNLTVTRNDNVSITTNISQFSGLTVNGGLSATTISACTGIYTSNLYGCSPITVNDRLILLSGLTFSSITEDNSLTQILSRDSSDGSVKYRDVSSIIGAASADTFVTGFTYDNINTFTITDNSGTIFNSSINVLSATTISATTYFGDGSNLTGIPHTTDTFVSGGTYNDITDIITFTNNTGGTFNVTGITDTFVTGMTFNTSTYDLTVGRNDDEDITESLAVLASDVYVLSGVYSASTGIVTYTNSTGGTFQVSGFTTGMTDSYTINAYISGTEIKFDNNIQGVDFYRVDLLPLLSGKTNVTLFNSYTSDTQTILDSKISGATNLSFTGLFAQKTGQNLEFKGITSTGSTVTITNDSTRVNLEVTIPDTNTFVSGGTYSDITDIITFTNTTGGTFNVTGITDTFVTGGTYNPGTVKLDFSGNSGFSSFSVDVSPLDTNFYTTGSTLLGTEVVFDRTDSLSAYTLDLSGLDVNDTFVTGFTYDDINTFTITRNDGTAFTQTINVLSATTISATTFYGDGSNLTGIPHTTDTFVSGGTYSDSTDIITFTNTTGGTFNVTGITDKFVTGGTYNAVTVNLDFSGNSGFSPFSIDVLALKDDTNTTITGFTYDDANTFTITDSSGSTFDASINIMTGLTINGDLNVNGESVFSGTSTDVVQIYGSGTTSPIFRIQGSSGELFSVTDSLVGELFAVNDISGLPILQVYSDNRIILGDNVAPSLYTTAKVTATSGSSTSIYSVPVSAYTGAWFEYTAKGTTSLRAGNIASIFSGTSISHNETTTTDIGDTSDLLLDVIISGTNATLTASATTSNWEIKTIIRSI